jgi:hypothetical protein
MTEIDDSNKLNAMNRINTSYYPNKNMKKYSNFISNQNNRRRNTRYPTNNNNNYIKNENFELKENGYNYSYKAYNNRGGTYNNNNNGNKPNRVDRTDRSEYNQCSNNNEFSFYNNNFFNNYRNYNYYNKPTIMNTFNNYAYDYNLLNRKSSDPMTTNRDIKPTEQINCGILNISVKLDNKTKIITLNRGDDFFQKARDFCIENNLPQKLILPLSIKLNYAVNSINKVLNTNLTLEDREYFNNLNSLWSETKAKEVTNANPTLCEEEEEEMTFSSISNIDEEISENPNINSEKSKLNRTF